MNNKFTITDSTSNINAIMHALKHCSYGIGISILCDIEYKKGERQSTIIFTKKNPRKPLKYSEFLQFGIIVQRDFIKSNNKT